MLPPCLPTTTRMEASKLHTQALLYKTRKPATARHHNRLPPTQEARPARPRHGDSDKPLVPAVFGDIPLVESPWSKALS